MKIATLGVLISGLAATACSYPEDHRANPAEGLFRQSVELVREYTLKIKNAPDSAAADSLMSRYQDMVDSLNFQYPPDTDLELTEGQNDTLTILSSRLIKVYNVRKSRLGNDTVPQVNNDNEN